MNGEYLYRKLKDDKGHFLVAEIHADVPLLKSVALGGSVTKHTKMHVITGIEFGNRKEVREGIEAGERDEVQPLPWGEWRKGRRPFIIDHTPKGQKASVEYFRLYLPTQAQVESFHLPAPQVEFAFNGQPITRQEAVELCGSKAQSRENESGCMTVRCENIVALG